MLLSNNLIDNDLLDLNLLEYRILNLRNGNQVTNTYRHNLNYI